MYRLLVQCNLNLHRLCEQSGVRSDSSIQLNRHRQRLHDLQRPRCRVGKH